MQVARTSIDPQNVVLIEEKIRHGHAENDQLVPAQHPQWDHARAAQQKERRAQHDGNRGVGIKRKCVPRAERLGVEDPPDEKRSEAQTQDARRRAKPGAQEGGRFAANLRTASLDESHAVRMRRSTRQGAGSGVERDIRR